MEVHSICEKGNRPLNEDFIISIVLNEQMSIHIVTDGMGGYGHGAWASKVVAETVVNYLQQHITKASSIESLIRDAVRLSNETLQIMKSQTHSKMGSTLAGLLLINCLAYVFWVGDARIYHIRNNQIAFQSIDHSLINQMASSGQIITPAAKQQYGHIVTRALQGNPDEVIPDIININSLNTSEQFILCSDGIHNVISPSQLEHLLVANPDPNNFIAEVKDICSQYGTDNYSLISIYL